MKKFLISLFKSSNSEKIDLSSQFRVIAILPMKFNMTQDNPCEMISESYFISKVPAFNYLLCFINKYNLLLEEFQDWATRATGSGSSSWGRSNLARQLPI